MMQLVRIIRRTPILSLSTHTSVSADESEAAWWVMQLRGMAWHFSTWHGGTMVRDVLGEQFIPSSFYGNKSPV
jgi:hypothetical protein